MGFFLKLDVQGQEGAIILDVDGLEVGGLENWTILMDVICVSIKTKKTSSPLEVHFKFFTLSE